MKSTKNRLVVTIREELQQVSKYEDFLKVFNEELREKDVKFTTKEGIEDVTEEEVVEFCVKNYTLRAMYNSDLNILHNKVVTYYRALILIGKKDLLTESEITILEGIFTQINKTKFLFNEKGELVEKVSGTVDKVREVLKESGQIEKVIKVLKDK